MSGDNLYVSPKGRRGCKTCRSDRMGKYWAEPANHEQAKEYQRQYRADPDYRDRHLRKRYGITLAQYDAMHDAQGGVCALCHQPETRPGRNGQTTALAVDHDHETGAIRGLLCSECNIRLAALDDSGWLERAIRYAGLLGSPKRLAKKLRAGSDAR